YTVKVLKNGQKRCYVDAFDHIDSNRFVIKADCEKNSTADYCRANAHNKGSSCRMFSEDKRIKENGMRWAFCEVENILFATFIEPQEWLKNTFFDFFKESFK
uniref:Uncharacterized protein n=1 Tax=Romanomermis culicivorax TaxID=13658 RepID=A0A915I2V1_ROMCU